MHARLVSLAAGAALALAVSVAALPRQATAAGDDAPGLGDPYPLGTCIVSGAELGDDAVAHDHEGRQLRFCSKACVAKFESDTKQWLSKLDAVLVKDQGPLYPLEICPVTSDPLDKKGAESDVIWRNRLIRLCCGSCIDAFDAEPRKYLRGLDRAIFEWQEYDYPLAKCVVDETEIGEEPVDVIIACRLFRVCSKACAKKLREKPAPAIATLDAARAAAEGEGEGD